MKRQLDIYELINDEAFQMEEEARDCRKREDKEGEKLFMHNYALLMEARELIKQLKPFK